MKIAIVDKDQNFTHNLQRYLNNELEKIGLHNNTFNHFSSSTPFLETFKDDNYDLIILEIHIDDFSGIDIAKKIRYHNKDVMIVFCSEDNNYASQSYELSVNYYLLKPLPLQKLKDMLSRINIHHHIKNKPIHLPDNFKVYVSQILYT